MTTIKEATFRHQFLTTDKVEVLLAQLHNLKALNLSQNKMNMLPRGIPSSLIALDLSYNLFATFPSSEKLHNLIELKLSNNSIERFVGKDCTIVSHLDCNVWF
jgi:Leucine-rich repeat (LRR) protein